MSPENGLFVCYCAVAAVSRCPPTARGVGHSAVVETAEGAPAACQSMSLPYHQYWYRMDWGRYCPTCKPQSEVVDLKALAASGAVWLQPDVEPQQSEVKHLESSRVKSAGIVVLVNNNN